MLKWKDILLFGLEVVIELIHYEHHWFWIWIVKTIASFTQVASIQVNLTTVKDIPTNGTPANGSEKGPRNILAK